MHIGETGAHAHVGPPRAARGRRPAGRWAGPHLGWPRGARGRYRPTPSDGPARGRLSRSVERTPTATRTGHGRHGVVYGPTTAVADRAAGADGASGRPGGRRRYSSTSGRGQGGRTMLESVAERSAVEPVRMAIMASRSARRNLAVLVAHVTPPARDPVEQRAGGSTPRPRRASPPLRRVSGDGEAEVYRPARTARTASHPDSKKC